MKSILLIDDCRAFRDIVTTILMDAQYDVWEAKCPDEAFTLLRKDAPDLIICDLHMPFTLGENFTDFEYSSVVGVRTIQELSSVYPKIPIIAVSAVMPDELPYIRKELGAIPTLSKPFHSSELLLLLEEYFSRGAVTYH